ncbi:MAG TPA: SIS domain-containing protein [Bryobacteraceae bacterium]|nr:SIS domain-containing protein [Bryobacteraceae bacterium]
MGLDFSLLEGGYLRDLLDEPRVLDRTLAGLKESAALAELARDLERGRFRRVVLTGMGGSYHALYPLFFALNRMGVTTLMVETSELIHSMPEVLDAATLLVVLSQSGRSVEVLRLLELRGAAPVIAVTNHADSDLATRADAVVLTQAGDEFSVSCKTYVASLLALQWLRGVLCAGDRGRVSDELHETASAAELYLNDWRDHVRELWSEMQDVQHLFLAGRGDSLATAGTGGLILKESTKFHAEGMSSAAFRHGPFEMTGPGVFVLVFEGERAGALLNKGLVDDVRKAGGRATLVGSAAELAACRLPAPWTLATPILEILPVQMLSLALAARANREPGKFHLITKVTTVE